MMMMMWDDDGGVMLVSFLADTTLHWEDPPHRTLPFPREFLQGLVKLGTGSEILIPMDAFWAIRYFLRIRPVALYTPCTSMATTRHYRQQDKK